MKRLLLIVLGLLSVSFSVHAASFDCAKAGTPVEKMICADAELSGFDAELGRVYGEALNQALDPATLKSEQLAWLKERNRCNNIPCLAAQYRQRLDALKPVPVFKTIYPVDISEFEIDCKEPKDSREMFICKEAERAYKEMRNALQWALMRSTDKRSIIETQRRWQNQVLDACQDGYCLRQLAYGKRTKELKALVARPNECYVPVPILADGYVKPIEPIFQAMEENLNQFCDQPPMVCEMQVAPQFRAQITFPTLIPLDPEANRGLIEDFFKTPWLARAKHPSTLHEEIWQDEKQKIESAFAGKTITFSKSEIDLCNLGKPQTAYRLDYGTCSTDNPQLKDRKDWNQPLKNAPVQIEFAPDIALPLYNKYFLIGNFFANEVFIYLGKTYSYRMFGYWQKGTGIPENGLNIFRREQWTTPNNSKDIYNLHDSWVCSFNYQPQEGKK